MIGGAIGIAIAIGAATAGVIVPADDGAIVAIGAAERDVSPGLLLRFSSAGIRIHASGRLRLIWADGDGDATSTKSGEKENGDNDVESGVESGVDRGIDIDVDERGGNRFVATVVNDRDGARRDVEVGTDGVIDVGEAAVVSVVKVTEGLFGARRLLAVDVDGALLPPPAPRPTLVVLGDSWATGFGVMGDIVDVATGKAPGPHCPFRPASQDVRFAWPWLLAEALGSDAAVVAWSGRGVMRDYEGDTRPTTVPAYYAASVVAPDDVVGVVVALGHNDGYPGVPDEAAFVAAWRQLVWRLRRDFPKAPIVAVVPTFDDVAPAIDRSAAFAAFMTHTNVIAVAEPTLDDRLGLGCVWHPGTRMQADLAKRLSPAVEAALRR